MSNTQKDSTKKTSYKIAWWVAFFLIFIVVGASTAGSIYPAVHILQSMFKLSFLPVSWVPFVSSYILPILPYIIQPLTHLGFLFSAFIWGKTYFGSTVKLIQRLFSSRKVNIVDDIIEAVTHELDIDLDNSEGNEKPPITPKDRMQHLAVFLLEKQIEAFHTLEKAAKNYQESNVKWVHYIPFLRTIEKSLVQMNAYETITLYLQSEVNKYEKLLNKETELNKQLEPLNNPEEQSDTLREQIRTLDEQRANYDWKKSFRTALYEIHADMDIFTLAFNAIKKIDSNPDQAATIFQQIKLKLVKTSGTLIYNVDNYLIPLVEKVMNDIKTSKEGPYLQALSSKLTTVLLPIIEAIEPILSKALPKDGVNDRSRKSIITTIEHIKKLIHHVRTDYLDHSLEKFTELSGAFSKVLSEELNNVVPLIKELRDNLQQNSETTSTAIASNSQLNLILEDGCLDQLDQIRKAAISELECFKKGTSLVNNTEYSLNTRRAFTPEEMSSIPGIKRGQVGFTDAIHHVSNAIDLPQFISDTTQKLKEKLEFKRDDCIKWLEDHEKDWNNQLAGQHPLSAHALKKKLKISSSVRNEFEQLVAPQKIITAEEVLQALQDTVDPMLELASIYYHDSFAPMIKKIPLLLKFNNRDTETSEEQKTLLEQMVDANHSEADIKEWLCGIDGLRNTFVLLAEGVFEKILSSQFVTKHKTAEDLLYFWSQIKSCLLDIQNKQQADDSKSPIKHAKADDSLIKPFNLSYIPSMEELEGAAKLLPLFKYPFEFATETKIDNIEKINSRANETPHTKKPNPIVDEKPRLWNWFSCIFFALAVAGFNFTVNLTAGVLLLNISQITSWQAVQASVLHSFASLTPFAQMIGIMGGIVTALVLIPFLLSFIKKGLKQKNASTPIKKIDTVENKTAYLYQKVKLNQHKKTQSRTERFALYFYEFICLLNGFFVNSFGIAFGTLAIVSTALSLISPGLQMSFPVVMSIVGVACFAGALAAITFTRNNTMSQVKSLFNRPVQHTENSTKPKQEVQWYAKIPRIITTLSNIVVLCAFTLSASSYWSVLFGASSFVRAVIATILLPCIWTLTNKIFKSEDIFFQTQIEAISSKVFNQDSLKGNNKITPNELMSETPTHKNVVGKVA